MIKLSDQPTVLIFAGQGNPAVGMGADLWDLNTTTRQIWGLRQRCDRVRSSSVVSERTDESSGENDDAAVGGDSYQYHSL